MNRRVRNRLKTHLAAFYAGGGFGAIVGGLIGGLVGVFIGAFCGYLGTLLGIWICRRLGRHHASVVTIGLIAGTVLVSLVAHPIYGSDVPDPYKVLHGVLIVVTAGLLIGRIDSRDTRG